jgi:hypothetical protein
MLGGLKLNRDSSAWLGLIDGIYAVSITLMITTSPSTLNQFMVLNRYKSGVTINLFEFFLLNMSIHFHIIVLVLFLLSFFIVLFDSWSIQRRQLQKTPLVDKIYCKYLSIALFSSILIPSICSLRIQSYHISESISKYVQHEYIGYKIQDIFILLLLVAHYLVLLFNERRIFQYAKSRAMHSTCRVCSFSTVAIRARLHTTILLTIFYLIVLLAGAPAIILSFFPILLAFTILISKPKKKLYRQLSRLTF